MSPTATAEGSFISTLQEKVRSKHMPPVLVFCAGAGGKDGYVSELIIHNFTKLDGKDTEMVVVLMRLLTVKASMGLVERWRDISVTCFLPVATSPNHSVLGVQLEFAPEKETTYQTYVTTYKDDKIEVVTQRKVQKLSESSALLQNIVERINPFLCMTYTDEGLQATVEMPDGTQFSSTGDVDEDILNLATNVQHSKLEVTP